MKKHYIIASCIIMAVLVAYYLFNTIPRRVPLDECSELYLHYAGQPGINASFVKDFRINDSLSVCATLLEDTPNPRESKTVLSSMSSPSTMPTCNCASSTLMTRMSSPLSWTID